MTTNAILLPTTPVRMDIDTPSEQEREFRSFFGENLFGQPDAENMMVSAYNASRAVLRRVDGPVFVGMSLGPSTTGKSEGPALLAEFLHGNRGCVVRYNLNQFQLPHQITDLIGSPSSYIGSDKPAGLSRVKLEESRKNSKNPKAPIILVLEEVEKAHASVFDVLLAILRDGETRVNGELTNYRDVIIIMTSNLAATEIAGLFKVQRTIGFGHGHEKKPAPTQAEIDKLVRERLAQRYRPEFLNRIEAVCVYRELDRENVRKIVQLEVKKLQKLVLDTMGERLFVLTVTDEAIDLLLETSIERAEAMAKTEEGAGSSIAELQRLMKSELFAPLNKLIDRGAVGFADQLTASVVDGEKKISFFNAAAPKEVKEARAAQKQGSAIVDGINTQSSAAAEAGDGASNGQPASQTSSCTSLAVREIAQVAILTFAAKNRVELFGAKATFEEAFDGNNGFELLFETFNVVEGIVQFKVAAPIELFIAFKKRHPRVNIETVPMTIQ